MIFGKYINVYYKKYRFYFLFGILSLVVVDIVQLFIPQLISEIIDKLTNLMDYKIDPTSVPINAPMWGKGTNLFGLNDYAYYFGSFGLIVICIAVCRCLWRLTLNIAQVRIERDLRKKMFYHVETLSTSFFNMQKTGGLMAYFTNDIESVSLVFSDGIIQVIDVFVLGVVAFVKMMMINYFLGLVCSIPMIILACCGYFIEKNLSLRYEKRQEGFESLSDFVQEGLSGISVVKAFVKEISQMKRFSEVNKYNKMVNVKYLKFYNMMDSLITGLIYSSFFVLVVLGGLMVLSPDTFAIFGLKNLTTGDIVAFFGYFSSLIWPMIAIGVLLNTMSKGKASLRRITTLLDTKNEVRDPIENSSSEENFVGDIEFKNLKFVYPDESNKDNYALEGITLKIKRGTRVGIIGKTGSGKSTFVNTLLKLYNIDRNMLFIDGIDINDYSSKKLREHIGYVAQETFLFSDYIDNNISFSDPDLYSDESIQQAARFACVDSNIVEFKNGYKTKIGERGATLSGGQKQRISLARAIIKDPDILILDDSVSALDSSTEKEILAHIEKQRMGKTTFVIAHRISSVEKLDLVLVFDEGKIVGCGTHDELIKSCELYRKLSKLQSLEKEVNK